MATEIPIPDSDLVPGKIIDNSLMTRMRDNPVAVVEGNGTTKIQSDAFSDNSLSGVKLGDNTTSGAKLLNNSVSAVKLQDGSVSGAKLNLITGSFTGNLAPGARADILFPQFVLNWRLEGGGIRIEGLVGGGGPTQPGFSLINVGGSSQNYTVYYQAFA